MSHRPRSAALPAADSAVGPDLRQGALLAAALAVLVAVLLPCVVRIWPTIYFEVDPRSPAGMAPITALGPAGAAWLQVTSVLAAAGAVAASLWAGGRVRWGACALAAVGMAACAYHMPGHFDNRLQGGAWIAAAALGLAAAHLGQHALPRRWLVAGLIAILIPMAVDAVWYIYVTHPATVESFQQTESAFLQSRGWEKGSSQHELYVRRLESPDAVGASGLANVLGSFAATLTVLAAGVSFALLVRPRRGRWAAAAASLALLGLITLALTHSKGAALALPVGLVLLALAGWKSREKAIKPSGRPATEGSAAADLSRDGSVARWLGGFSPLAAFAVALVVLAFVAVLVRGAMGPPESVEGERSLLFRYQYWTAAARLIGENLPAHALLGTGPAGFEAGYLRTQDPLSPEQVNSAHNVAVDYITMLGVGGWAWCLLLLGWLWQAGQAAGRRSTSEETALPSNEPDSVSGNDLLIAAAPAAVVFGTQYALQLPEMYADTALLWLGGALAWVGVTAALAVALAERRRQRWITVGLFAAAGVVLVHGQIEMTFYQLASAGFVWAVMGLAAGGAEAFPRTETERHGGWKLAVPPIGLVLVAAGLALGHAAPMSAQQAHLASATALLQQSAAKSTLPLAQQRAYAQAMAELDAAAATLPRDPDVLRWRVSLRLQDATGAAHHGRRDIARELIRQALLILDEAEANALPSHTIDRHRARVQLAAADLLAEPDRLKLAAAAMERVIAQNPYSLSDHIELADLHWQLGDRRRAAELYQRSLQLSDQFYLDPARQLASEERRRLEARLAEGMTR